MQFPSLDKKSRYLKYKPGQSKSQSEKKPLVLIGFEFFFILIVMVLDNAFGVFLAPSGQHHTNPSPAHNWNNLCVWGAKGSIEPQSTSVSRNGQSATRTGEKFWFLPLILTHTKQKKNIFPAPRYNASCCEGEKEEKKKITDFFLFKKE